MPSATARLRDGRLTANAVPTLRISHTGSHVEAMLEVDGQRLTEKRPFSFTLSAQEAEDIRWYLEDYRIYPVEPQPKDRQTNRAANEGGGAGIVQISAWGKRSLGRDAEPSW